MKYKHHSITILIIACLVFSLNGSAQNKVDTTQTITFIVIDSNDNEVIPFAPILLYQDSVNIGIGCTDIEGKVEIRCSNKYALEELWLKALYTGYADKISKLTSAHIKIRLRSTSKPIIDYIIWTPATNYGPAHTTVYRDDLRNW